MPPITNPVAEKQALALRKRALELALDFSKGRPPTQEAIAAELGVHPGTLRRWFSDDTIVELLNEVAPLWPNVGHSRNVATENLDRALQFVVQLVNGEIPKARPADRLKAAQLLMGLAGVKPGALAAGEEAGKAVVERRPAVNIELHVSGVPARLVPDVIDGRATVVGEEGTGQ